MPRDPKADAINVLRTQLDEMRAKVIDARKTNDRLREEAESKIQVIKKIESEIREEDEIFQKKRDDALRKRKDKREDYLVKLNSLKSEQQVCLDDLSRVDLSQQEHHRLDAKLREITLEYYREDRNMSEQIEQRKKQAFDMKMDMDLVFRKTLASFEEEYKQHADEVIEEEAIQAQATVKDLEHTSGEREQECLEIIKKQRDSYDRLVKLKVDLDVLVTTNHMQEKMSWKIEAANKSIQEELEVMLDRCDRLTLETKEIQGKMFERNSLIEELEIAEKRLDEITLKVTNSEAQAKRLCQEILREAVRISDEKKAESFNQLCEKFSDIVDMNVERKAGSVLIVEKKLVVEEERSDDIQDDDDCDYEAMWRSDKYDERTVMSRSNLTCTPGKRSSRMNTSNASRNSKKPTTALSNRSITAKQRLHPISKSFSMMS